MSDSQRKSCWARPWTAIAWLVLAALIAGTAGARAATTGQFWSDASTGFAIGGYDPIAYFADGRASKGSERYEMQWGGVTWRFVNSGNLAAFRDHPEIYVPEFGGYGAMKVARGYTGVGNPLIWTLRGGRLYLFYSTNDQLDWLANPEKWTAKAEETWPKLRQSLPF